MAARSIILRWTTPTVRQSGGAYPQACRKRRGRVHLQPARHGGKYRIGEIPGPERRPKHRHRLRLEQVHQREDYPLTTTGLVSYDIEGQIYAKYLSKTLPTAKYAILYQNDDLGKDYVNAFRAFLKSDFDKRVVTAAYEVTEPTVDSQVVNLKSSGAEAFFIAGTPKFAAQAIRKAAEIGWKPTVIIDFPSSSIAGR